ncbi:hypothetical protein ACJ41O_012922 [Fusarium nematophilum]
MPARRKEHASETGGVPVQDTVDTSTVVTDAQAFCLSGRDDVGWQNSSFGRGGKIQHTFDKPLPIVPTVIYGFRTIDVGPTNSPRVALSLPSVSETGFTLSVKSFLHETHNLEANVMVLPNGKIPFQHGYVDASDTLDGRQAKENAAVSVSFEKSFDEPPKVYVWFTEISQPHGPRRIKTYVTNVTRHSMTVKIDTWATANSRVPKSRG